MPEGKPRFHAILQGTPTDLACAAPTGGHAESDGQDAAEPAWCRLQQVAGEPRRACASAERAEEGAGAYEVGDDGAQLADVEECGR